MEIITKKLVAVGDKLCGKNSLLAVMLGNEFSDHGSNIVIAQTFMKILDVDGIKVMLELNNTAGQGDYDRLRPVVYPGTDVFLMCFSVDNPDSLVNISELWVPEVKNFCPNVPIILVANKKDLRNDEHIHNQLAQSEQKLLRTEDGRSMAIRISAYEYLECSAKTNDGVRELVETAARAALQKKHGPIGKSRSCCKLL